MPDQPTAHIVANLYATDAQFAERLTVSVTTVRRWRKKGMPAMKAGQIVRIPIAKAEAWLASQGAPKAPRTKRPTT